MADRSKPNEPMVPLAVTAATLTSPSFEKASTRDSEANPPKCWTCFDTGTELTETGARGCVCRRNTQRRLERLLGRIPSRYAGVSLAELQPRPDLHPDQPKIVEFMRTHPELNYYLCGMNDVGKSHLLWALYEAAVSAGRDVVASTLYDMVEEAKAMFGRNQSKEVTWSSLSHWRRDLSEPGRHYAIFIEDIDKVRPTEYVAELFFAYVDAIYNYKHQLVVTSQLDPENRIGGRDSLIEHFERADPRYAVGIVRRIVNDETAIWRLF